MSLREWYANRELLLTGATSELGRHLLEKILRSFPDVKVYAVIRPKDGTGKDDRIRKILQSPRFERLRQEDPDAFSRVKAVEGNFLENDLGISKEDRASLKDVSVVFHAGGPHDAVFEFCRDLPNLKVLCAVSTIFRHKGQIKESAQNEKVPEFAALVRLGCVGPAYKEPMPGFVETFKGSTALMVGAGIAWGKKELHAEVIPIDMAVNTMIGTAWEKGRSTEGPLVCNATSLGCTWEELIKKGQRANWNYGYPSFGFRGMTSMWALFWLLVLFEWLASVICDAAIAICGGKQRLVTEYTRIRRALSTLTPITCRPWPVERYRIHHLQTKLTPEEQESFPVTANIDVESYVLCAAAAVRKHCVDAENVGLVKMFRRALMVGVAAVFTYLGLTRYRAMHRVESVRD